MEIKAEEEEKTIIIPAGWRLCAVPPYLRPITPFGVKNRTAKNPTWVLGVNSTVWDWLIHDVKVKCDNPNCNGTSSFVRSTKLGDIFFMDIDEKLDMNNESNVFHEIMAHYNISTLLVVDTKAGHHLISFDIRPNKIAWYRVFKQFQRLYKSDYEYSVEWVLRIGKKGNNPPPTVNTLLRNFRVSGKSISAGHVAVYTIYANLSKSARNIILQDNIAINTYTDLIKYKSWAYEE